MVWGKATIWPLGSWLRFLPSLLENPLPILNLIQGLMGGFCLQGSHIREAVLGRGKGDLRAPSGSQSLLRSHVHPLGDLPPLVLSPSQYHNYTQPRGNFIPYANEERREYR